METIAVHVQADEAICEILTAELGELGYDIFEPQALGMSAYVNADRFEPSDLEALMQRYQGLGPISYHTEVLAKQNWNAVWESNYDPIRIEDRLLIRASFHASEPGFAMELIINPKMSFGTGHHETTHLMASALFDLDLQGKSVLDAGTGTGLLALIALKLGADPVHAFDIDTWSVENTLENAALNGLSLGCDLGTIREQGPKTYEVLLANINRNILLDEMAEYALRLQDQGRLLLSGFYQEDVDILLQVAHTQGLELEHQANRGPWTMLQLVKTHP